MTNKDAIVRGAYTIPNCVRIYIAWTLPNTKTVYNILHGQVAGGFTATSTVAENIFSAVKAAGGWTSWKANVNSGVSFAAVSLRDMRALNQPLVTSTTGASAGTGAGTALPPGDALIVTLRTGSAGRSFRGRVYLPGLDSTALAAGGVAAAGTMTNAKAFVDAVSTALTGQSITLSIGQPPRNAYTSDKGTAHLARAATVVNVTSTVVRNNIIDHQRRRAGRS